MLAAESVCVYPPLQSVRNSNNSRLGDVLVTHERAVAHTCTQIHTHMHASLAGSNRPLDLGCAEAVSRHIDHVVDAAGDPIVAYTHVRIGIDCGEEVPSLSRMQPSPVK